MNKRAFIDSLKHQYDLHQKIRSSEDGVGQLHLPKEIIFEKLFEAFKLGILAGLLGAAGGGALGSLVDAPEYFAGRGASLGIAGGTIKGHTDVDKRVAAQHGYEAQFPNIFKYLVGTPTINYPLAALSPDSGHIILKKV